MYKTLNLSPSAETYSVAPREPQPLNVIYSEEALTVSRRLFPKQLLSLLSLCLLSTWRFPANANMIWCVFPRAPRPPALWRGLILENFLSSVMCNIRMCQRGSRALCILTSLWCCDALHGSEELQDAHQWECNILHTDSVKRKSYDMSERPKRKGQVSPRTPHPALILREPPALALEPDHSSAEPCGGWGPAGYCRKTTYSAFHTNNIPVQQEQLESVAVESNLKSWETFQVGLFSWRGTWCDRIKDRA